MSSFEIKDSIIDSASKFFAKFGYRKTTMDEIARNIHKAKGLLYYYFKNKESLFNEVLKSELQYVKEELKSVVEKESESFDMIEKYLMLRFKLLHNCPNYHETLRADFFENFYFVKDVRDDFANFERSQLTYIINKGKEDGFADIGDTYRIVEVIMLLFSSLEVSLFIQDKFEAYGSTIDQLIQFVISALKTAKNKS